MAISELTSRAAGTTGWRGWSPRIPQAAVEIGLLALWQVAASAGGLGAVPTPIEVFAATFQIFAQGSVWEPLGLTLASWAVSLLFAVVVGVVVGFPLGINRFAYRVSVATLDFLRTIPALVLIPLMVLLYGSGFESTVLLSFFAAVWAIIMQTIYGARDVDPVARDTFRSLRTTRWDRTVRLLIPSAAPYIATGIRLAAAVCLLVTISAQIVIPAGGFGEQILTSQLGGAIAEMYAYIMLCGLLGLGVDATFRALERAALAWHPAHRKDLA